MHLSEFVSQIESLQAVIADQLATHRREQTLRLLKSNSEQGLSNSERTQRLKEQRKTSSVVSERAKSLAEVIDSDPFRKAKAALIEYIEELELAVADHTLNEDELESELEQAYFGFIEDVTSGRTDSEAVRAISQVFLEIIAAREAPELPSIILQVLCNEEYWKTGVAAAQEVEGEPPTIPQPVPDEASLAAVVEVSEATSDQVKQMLQIVEDIFPKNAPAAKRLMLTIVGRGDLGGSAESLVAELFPQEKDSTRAKALKINFYTTIRSIENILERNQESGLRLVTTEQGAKSRSGLAVRHYRASLIEAVTDLSKSEDKGQPTTETFVLEASTDEMKYLLSLTKQLFPKAPDGFTAQIYQIIVRAGSTGCSIRQIAESLNSANVDQSDAQTVNLGTISNRLQDIEVSIRKHGSALGIEYSKKPGPDLRTPKGKKLLVHRILVKTGEERQTDQGAAPVMDLEIVPVDAGIADSDLFSQLQDEDVAPVPPSEAKAVQSSGTLPDKRVQPQAVAEATDVNVTNQFMSPELLMRYPELGIQLQTLYDEMAKIVTKNGELLPRDKVNFRAAWTRALDAIYLSCVLSVDSIGDPKKNADAAKIVGKFNSLIKGMENFQFRLHELSPQEEGTPFDALLAGIRAEFGIYKSLQLAYAENVVRFSTPTEDLNDTDVVMELDDVTGTIVVVFQVKSRRDRESTEAIEVMLDGDKLLRLQGYYSKQYHTGVNRKVCCIFVRYNPNATTKYRTLNESTGFPSSQEFIDLLRTKVEKSLKETGFKRSKGK